MTGSPYSTGGRSASVTVIAAETRSMPQDIPPYFLCNLLSLPLVIAAFAVGSTQRRAMVVSGLGVLLLGLTPVYDPKWEGWYWNPGRFGGWVAGIEDVLFMFQAGVLIWFVASWRFRHRLATTGSSRRRVLRYMCLLACGIACIFGLGYFGMDFTLACFVTTALAFLFLLWAKRSLWPLSVTGCIGFTTLYSIQLTVWLWLWPGALHPGNSHGIFANKVLGMPIGEVVWAVLFAAAHPLGIGYILGVELRPCTEQEEKITLSGTVAR